MLLPAREDALTKGVFLHPFISFSKYKGIAATFSIFTKTAYYITL